MKKPQEKREYDHLKIEKKWQTEWTKKKAYKAENKSKKKKCYVLDMFPYPSGKGLHVGHPKGYIGSDVYARMKRMQGFNVLHPMGYDAFGLPAEQYALEHDVEPRQAVLENIKTFEKQLSIIGLSYDWDRKINTTDPEYYRWTQWIFLKIFDSWYNKKTNKAEPIENLVRIFETSGNKSVSAVTDSRQTFSAKEWKAMTDSQQQAELMKYRLAYEGRSEVNWCPALGTVLANDEIVDGPNGPVSERGGYPVEKKLMRQWFMRITAYAERLLAGLDTLPWSEHIKDIQRNWIGKSEGSEIAFTVEFENGQKSGVVHVFTTRPDTLFGVTALVLAPDHPLVSLVTSDTHSHTITNSDEVRVYVEEAKSKPDTLQETNEKTGVRLVGVSAINPANKEKIPVYVADYVISSYGTGAVMSVPAHDERDFEFAQKYNLPMRQVITPVSSHALSGTVLPYIGEGTVIESGEFTGMDSLKARKAITKFVRGKIVMKYKMRDAVFARQRYWGEPIPLTHDADGVIHPLPPRALPLTLPRVKSYKPTGTGESPLASVSSWMKKGLETNTMPGWAGSSWYFLRYMDPRNKKAFADKTALKYWKNVDVYVGGQEHATGHVLYARFWHKFLYDYGLVMVDEPFQMWRQQGMILGSDNRKMSKRWGNVINPDEVVHTYGADTLRLYEMFMGPFDASLPWSTDNIIGSRRFVERVWRMAYKVVVSGVVVDKKFEILLHKTIKKITDDIETFSFNTSVSALMILINEMERNGEVSKNDFEVFLKLLSPFAPHIAEELWHWFGHKTLIVQEEWPKADPAKMTASEVRIIVQIDGKVRGQFIAEPGITESEALRTAKGLESIAKWLLGKQISKVFYIQDKLLNIVL